MQLIPGRLSTGLVRQNALFQAIFFSTFASQLELSPSHLLFKRFASGSQSRESGLKTR